jgi:hypothetical protein
MHRSGYQEVIMACSCNESFTDLGELAVWIDAGFVIRKSEDGEEPVPDAVENFVCSRDDGDLTIWWDILKAHYERCRDLAVV